MEQAPPVPLVVRVSRVLGDRGWLLAFVVVGLVLRVPFLGEPLSNDEGGYAYVARAWGEGSGGLYGDQWVDRPPLLFALYWVALMLGGDIGVRLLGCLAAAATVVCCGGAAGALAGSRALRWSGFCALALTSSIFIQSHMVNAELLALPFVAGSVWLAVGALRARMTRRSAWLGFAAGVSAMAAMLIKQSFVDGLVFSAVLVAAAALLWSRAGRSLRPVAATLAGGGAAIVLMLAAVLAWAQFVGPGVGALLDALYGFRLEARQAIGLSQAPDERARRLVVLAALSGLVSLFVVVAIGLVRIGVRGRDVARGDALLVRAGALALLALGSWALFAITQGGNWWRHYLMQLVPALTIGAGLLIGTPGDVRRSTVARSARWWGWVVAAGSVSAWIAGVLWLGSNGTGQAQQVTGDWLRSASREGETLLVTWGNANVLHRSGLRTPYALSWSLPVRIRDPKLEELAAVLEGPDAPTWIVRWHSIGLWDLDDDRDVRAIVRKRYQLVAEVCDKPVYRLRVAYPPSDPVPPPPPLEQCNRPPLEVFGIPIAAANSG